METSLERATTALVLTFAGLLLLVPLLGDAAASTGPGALEGTVKVVTDSVASRVSGASVRVVYLEDAAGDPSTAFPTGPFELSQIGKDFDPPVLLVPKGATVAFPNLDPVFHNVFSVTPGARFNLGQHKPGERPTVRMDRAGLVSVYCNIHPQMVGYILVMGNPSFARVREDGTFRLKGVAPGTYRAVAWFPYGPPVTQTVTIGPGGTTRADFILRERTDVTRHLRKDGTHYGDYTARETR